MNDNMNMENKHPNKEKILKASQQQNTFLWLVKPSISPKSYSSFIVCCDDVLDVSWTGEFFNIEK